MDDLRRRLMFSEGGGGGLLPKEYQQVEYLQNTGTQYINTGVSYNTTNGTRVVADILAIQTYSGAANCYTFFGSGTASGSTPTSTTVLQLRGFNNVQNTVAFGSSQQCVTTASVFTPNVFFNLDSTMKVGNNSIKIDGITKAQTTMIDYGAGSTLNYYLFAYNLNNSPHYGTPTGTISIKIKIFSIYEGDTLVRNFIPCYRKSDGVAGMYDTVSKTFFTNAGTGEFICGRSIVTDDTRFTQVLAIQSSGTQTINTDITATSNSGCQMIFSMNSISAHGRLVWAGGISQFISTYNNQVYFYFAGVLKKQTNISTSTIYEVRSNYFNDSNAYLDNALQASGTMGNAAAKYYLLSQDNSNYYAKANVYMCRLTVGSNYARDYIPCVLEQTVTDYWGNSQEKGTVGMWDLISDKFFPNNGTGTFAIVGGYNIPTEGLITEYLFNDNTNDTSGNGNNLTNSGVTFTSSGLAGIVKAGVFNGSAYAQGDNGLFPTNGVLSISTWVNASQLYGTTSAAANVLFRNVGSPTNGYNLGVYTTDGIFAKMWSGGTQRTEVKNGSGAAVVNTWYHVALVYDGTKVSLYVNGSFVTSASYSLYPTTIGSNFRFSDSSYPYWGKVAAFRVYSRALTASEVTMLYNEGLGII